MRIMATLPWLTLTTSPGGNTLTCHEPPLHLQNTTVESCSKPSYITIVGKRSKSALLDQMLGDAASVPVHRDVYLWSSPQMRTGAGAPLVIIDCGVQNSNQQPADSALINGTQTSKSLPIPFTESINAMLCGTVFSPFSSVLCCVVSDLGGPKAVAKWLARQAALPKSSDLPTVPRVLLVVETTSETFDERIAAQKATVLLLQAMQRIKAYPSSCDAERAIRQHFGDIEVLGLRSSKSNSVRARRLKNRLLSMSEASMQERANMSTQFSYSHFLVLSKQLLCNMSSTGPFHFAEASRPSGYSAEHAQSCLTDFLQQLPSQAWLWHFAAPIIASALLLSSYPPHAHSKSPTFYTQRQLG
jgi:hypothetical protein